MGWGFMQIGQGVYKTGKQNQRKGLLGETFKTVCSPSARTVQNCAGQGGPSWPRGAQPCLWPSLPQVAGAQEQGLLVVFFSFITGSGFCSFNSLRSLPWPR